MKKLYVFRKYKIKQGRKRTRHPKLIVDETSNDYGYMGLTSSKTKGRGHNNLPLKHNPQKGNNKQAYLRRKIEYDLKNNFEQILDDYQLSEEDKQFVIDYVNRHKKR